MGKTEVRQRRKQSETKKTVQQKSATKQENVSGKQADESEVSFLSGVADRFAIVIGLVCMVYIAYKHSMFILTIHETNLWFTNIKEVEREISFRTESGLYYSYYKQLILAPTVQQGVNSLMTDNITEHPSTINVLQRMNIYQEVILAVVYRALPYLQKNVLPIFFYIYSIFGLQGLLICSLYSLTWLLSNSWLAGTLSALFYIFNRLDTTRVEYIIPLRENFSLPFLWMQLAAITYYFRLDARGFKKSLSIVAIMLSTFLFALFWQFNQFILLLQAMALFGVQTLQFVPLNKIRSIYYIQLLSMFAVYALQFWSEMIPGGLLYSFVPAALVLNYIQERRSKLEGLVKTWAILFVNIISVFVLMIIINKTIKFFVHVDSDEHIYKFVFNKFGLGYYNDFDVRLYLCNGAFTFLESDVVRRMTSHLAFPPYCIVQFITFALLFAAYWTVSRQGRNSDHWYVGRPELAFHVVQIFFFATLAITTIRLKYLWTPYVCVFASLLVSDSSLFSYLFRKIHVTSTIAVSLIRHSLTVTLICAVLYNSLPAELKSLENLGEFWDPDTVQLMEWINKETPKTAAFSGSMQLLAGVKLCTRRPITNHPHYENKDLRIRTKELYSYYARSSAEEVRQILKKYKTSYIIMEDSICRAPSKGGCRLPDLLDIDRGEVPDGGQISPGLKKSSVPRFCWQVRFGEDHYGAYFKKVLENKTFKVYKVL